MRTITDIYNEYKIMPNLQMHQLRVAAVASAICDSLDIQVKKGDIVMACLLHDMGNIIKFDLIQTKEIFGLSDKEIEEIAILQKEFIEKYTEDEHVGNIKIAEELGVSRESIELISKNRFRNLCIDKDGNDWPLKIMHYSDSRVGPQGIVSYDDRMADAKERYKNHKNKGLETERQMLVDCGKEIEKQIFSHSHIKPEDINDESVAANIESLKHLSI